MASITMVGITALVGVLIGYGIKELFGGRRSSIGVHRSDGRLLPFWLGFLFFSIITIFAALTTTAVSSLLAEAISGFGGLVIAFGGVALFLTAISYSR